MIDRIPEVFYLYIPLRALAELAWSALKLLLTWALLRRCFRVDRGEDSVRLQFILPYVLLVVFIQDRKGSHWMIHVKSGWGKKRMGDYKPTFREAWRSVLADESGQRMRAAEATWAEKK